VPWHCISEAVFLGRQVYFSGGQREIRCRRLPVLIRVKGVNPELFSM
jgi:hypothetical protein